MTQTINPQGLDYMDSDGVLHNPSPATLAARAKAAEAPGSTWTGDQAVADAARAAATVPVPPLPTDGLQQYRSIKLVRAGQITELASSGAYVTQADGTSVLMPYQPNQTARYAPQVGDFWVVYDDGYQAISPREPFLAGYRDPAHVVAPADVDKALAEQVGDVPTLGVAALGDPAGLHTVVVAQNGRIDHLEVAGNAGRAIAFHRNLRSLIDLVRSVGVEPGTAERKAAEEAAARGDPAEVASLRARLATAEGDIARLKKAG